MHQTQLLTKNRIELIRNYFIKNKETLTAAESVTAGNIQAVISTAKDASCFFQGGIVAYNLGQKCRMLDIDPILADGCNCVSPAIAESMAKKACQMFTAHVGIGITGFASLAPEMNIHKLFAYISIVRKSKMLITKKIIPGKNQDPNLIQHYYTDKAIETLVSVLER
jgi:PncC family amidohydrolase